MAITQDLLGNSHKNIILPRQFVFSIDHMNPNR